MLVPCSNNAGKLSERAVNVEIGNVDLHFCEICIHRDLLKTDHKKWRDKAVVEHGDRFNLAGGDNGQATLNLFGIVVDSVMANSYI